MLSVHNLYEAFSDVVDKAKKYGKVGAGLVGGGLAAYGAYKMGDEISAKNKLSNLNMSSTDPVGKHVESLRKFKELENKENIKNKPTIAGRIKNMFSKSESPPIIRKVPGPDGKLIRVFDADKTKSGLKLDGDRPAKPTNVSSGLKLDGDRPAKPTNVSSGLKLDGDRPAKNYVTPAAQDVAYQPGPYSNVKKAPLNFNMSHKDIGGSTSHKDIDNIKRDPVKPTLFQKLFPNKTPTVQTPGVNTSGRTKG